MQRAREIYLVTDDPACSAACLRQGKQGKTVARSVKLVANGMDITALLGQHRPGVKRASRRRQPETLKFTKGMTAAQAGPQNNS